MGQFVVDRIILMRMSEKQDMRMVPEECTRLSTVKTITPHPVYYADASKNNSLSLKLLSNCLQTYNQGVLCKTFGKPRVPCLLYMCTSGAAELCAQRSYASSMAIVHQTIQRFAPRSSTGFQVQFNHLP